jgi:hypothetical protein
VSAVRWNQYKAHYKSHGLELGDISLTHTYTSPSPPSPYTILSPSGLCPDTYPDEVCRGNFSLHSYDPPLLYDVNSDPGEIYQLDPTLYASVLSQIDKKYVTLM